ncbi:MAG: SPOR domain-containing protein [Pseudomonadota bacterium]
MITTKDYAATQRPKRKAGASRSGRKMKPAKSQVPGWLWLTLGLVIGVFTSFLLFLGRFNDFDFIANDSQASTLENQEQIKPQKSAPPITQDPQYSFHEILKEKTVEVETEVLATKGTFVMQCGAFRQIEMADNLKAKLAMLGLQAEIKLSDTPDTGSWYRVLLGPYSSKRAAENDRHRLQDNQINRCKIW